MWKGGSNYLVFFLWEVGIVSNDFPICEILVSVCFFKVKICKLFFNVTSFTFELSRYHMYKNCNKFLQ